MHAPTQLLNQLAFIHDAVKSVHHFVLLQPTRVTLITINFIGLSGQARMSSDRQQAADFAGSLPTV